jgi:hypothetical protein
VGLFVNAPDKVPVSTPAVEKSPTPIAGRVLYMDVPLRVMSIVIADVPGLVFTLNTGSLLLDIRNAKGARILIVLEVDIVFVVVGNTVNSSLSAPPTMIGFVTPANVSGFVLFPMAMLPESERREFAVITAAEKLPEASRATIAPDVLALVALIFHV